MIYIKCDPKNLPDHRIEVVSSGPSNTCKKLNGLLQDNDVPVVITGHNTERGHMLKGVFPIRSLPIVVIHKDGESRCLGDTAVVGKSMTLKYYDELAEEFGLIPYEQIVRTKN